VNAAVVAALAAAACGDGLAVARAPRFGVDAPPAEMVVGQEAPVAVRWTDTPPADARVTWIAAPDSVLRIVAASPTGATLEARRVGSAAVTVTAGIGRSGTSYTFPVRVQAGQCLAAGFALQPASATIGVDGQVRVVVAPPGPLCNGGDTVVTFRAQDTTIAVVDARGLVTGRRPGVTSIVASPSRNPGFTAVATVTVLAPGTMLGSIVVEPGLVDATVGDTVRLRAFHRSPSGLAGGPAVRLSVADATTASVDADGLLRALRVGETHVRATATADTALWITVPVRVRPR
jgi:hypothetical protein